MNTSFLILLLTMAVNIAIILLLLILAFDIPVRGIGILFGLFGGIFGFLLANLNIPDKIRRLRRKRWHPVRRI